MPASDIPATRETVLQRLLPGSQIDTGLGRHYVIRTPLASLWPEIRRHLAIARARWQIPASASPQQRETAQEFMAHFPGACLFLDLETCGFAGTAIFLAGLVYPDEDGTLVLEQHLARHYCEEASLLESLWRVAAQSRVLVTFNGKSFDWPMVHDRSSVHRLGRDLRPARSGKSQSPSIVGAEPIRAPAPLTPQDPRPELLHFDLLHPARRRWKGRLPNCKLQTLERYLCRRIREDDIPGSRIPDAYHAFVRGSDARAIQSIVRHNALDLLTLVQLSLRILL
jgi:uncharacterized protein YprB with RNaseH-like and TPR domain